MQRLLPGKHTHEGILRNIRRITSIAKLAAQPTVQPAVIIGIQNVDLVLCKISGRHSALLVIGQAHCRHQNKMRTIRILSGKVPILQGCFDATGSHPRDLIGREATFYTYEPFQ